VGVAGQLPEPLGLVVLANAREAFVAGLHLAALISAAVALAAGLLAVMLLRSVRASAEPEAKADPQHALRRPTARAQRGED
jgi:DHA2 family multidrug resistance protein-like MFS transporter